MFMRWIPTCLVLCVLSLGTSSAVCQDPNIEPKDAAAGEQETPPNDEAFEAAAAWEPISQEKATERLARMLIAFDVPAEKQQLALDSFKSRWFENTDLLSLEIELLTQSLPSIQETFQRWQQSTDGLDTGEEQKFSRDFVADARVAIGRDLARNRLYDEALKWLTPVNPVDTIDPATLLFFRAVCRHTLWEDPEKAKEDLKHLMRRESQIPVRYRMTAKLMLADLTPQGKPNPLDEVSRLMSDVGRRLDLGRAGDPEVKREVEIIEKLDKLIEDLEKQRQQQQQQQQAAANGNSKNSQTQPMQDSQIAGGSGAGDVDRKKLDDERKWGDLPPAEREQALQKIGQQLPSHYREVIEGYFRKISSESSPPALNP